MCGCAEKRTDLRGRDYYWMGFRQERSQPRRGHRPARRSTTGKISVTPLHIDLTHRRVVHKLKGVLGGAPPQV